LAVAGDSNALAIENQKYAGGVTTADLVVPKGKALVVLSFLHTEGGVKDVHLLRPGYPRDTKQVFSTPFLNAIKPFPVLRFMDWLDSNGTNPFFGDAKNTTEWSDRHVPTDASFERRGPKFGVPWEYVIRLANEANKDIWINIPIAASDDYIKQLAQLMKRDLHAGAKIYLEYSNEVWNWGFLQATYNRMAAEAEVKKGGSNLNNDGEKSWDVWRRRRHARRTIEIGRIFTSTFGPASFGTRIRPVMSWWVIAPDQYRDMLEWVQRTYGPPAKVLYAVAGAPYFNTEKAPKNASVGQILDAMAESSSQSATMRAEMIGVAKRWDLKAFCYEGGPDSGGGSPVNIANRIRAQRDPRMKDLVRDDLDRYWYKAGGGLFMYFTLTSAYSRYGMWGLSDDVTKTDTPKWQAVRAILKGP